MEKAQEASSVSLRPAAARPENPSMSVSLCHGVPGPERRGPRSGLRDGPRGDFGFCGSCSHPVRGTSDIPRRPLHTLEPCPALGCRGCRVGEKARVEFKKFTEDASKHFTVDGSVALWHVEHRVTAPLSGS